MSQSPAKTDEELVSDYRASHNNAVIGELFKRHSLMCFAVCNKYLQNQDAAKDAAMAVFEKLFTDLQKHYPLNFKSWLYTVCKNHCLMQLRKPIVEVSAEETPEIFMELGFALHHTDESEKEQRLQALENALVYLNEKQRVCISLFYLQQKSYDEISRQTGYTANEVKSYIQNGKRNLKTALVQKGIVFGWILIWIQQLA